MPDANKVISAAPPDFTNATKKAGAHHAVLAGFLGWTGYIPHSVSKAGVSMLTRLLAKALAPEIRVNAIAPGTITMPGDPPDLAADFIKRAPLHRTGTTEDVTAAISFLINSPFITGEVLMLDGGRTL